MHRTLIVVLCLILVLTALPTSSNAQLLWRDAATPQTNGVFSSLRVDYALYQYANSAFADFDIIDSYQYLMLGGVPLPGLEVFFVLPFRYSVYPESMETDQYGRELGTYRPSSFGLSDASVMARYAGRFGENSEHAYSIGGGVRVPTGTTVDDVDTRIDHDVPLGDGSYDYLLGGAIAFQLSSRLSGLVKAQLWINGEWTNEHDSTINYGDEFSGSVLVGYKLKPSLELRSGISHVNTTAPTYNDRISSFRTYHYDLEIEALYNWTDSLQLRPSVSIPFSHPDDRGLYPNALFAFQLEYLI